ncbi:porin family protein [Hymenobacter cellulosilyticus]|uniref:PorT family protein n=1 Tax=Hymenobacter cellulosilyticus TaxID=2932248 RepID=A0A8T9QE67_9BACT|nr:porin family protein [Hymenobacter cellulosilyticus]UOQ73859.1 PorT family protein [Hymenobacter cellulosilyticus]
MNKAFLIVSTLLLAAGTSQAQVLRVGLKFGGNVSNAVGYDANKSNWRVGGHGGLMAQLRPSFLPKWGLQTEALYTMKGDNSLQNGPSLMTHLAYLDIPVLLQYHWDDIFFEAGPQASYLLSATPANPTLKLLGTSSFQQWCYGFAAGFGYQDKSGVQIGWRYNADLTNARKRELLQLDAGANGEPAAEARQVRLRNSVMELYLGYNVGTGQLGGAVVDAGTGIGRGLKFVFFTGPRRLLFGRKKSAAPAETPAAPATAPAPAASPKPVTAPATTPKP